MLPLIVDENEVRNLGPNIPSYTCKNIGLHSSKLNLRKSVLESKPCALK